MKLVVDHISSAGVDWPEGLDGPEVHYTRCGICGKRIINYRTCRPRKYHRGKCERRAHYLRTGR